jgi:hypothetical protein
LDWDTIRHDTTNGRTESLRFSLGERGNGQRDDEWAESFICNRF